jgi:membrane fusion protein (multidrug efflux system)
MGRIIVVLILGLAACGDGGDHRGRGGKHGKNKNQVVDRRVLVDAKPAALGSVPQHLVTTGSLESEAQADITPEASGVVTRIEVEEGDPVHKGQLLAVLANPTLEAAADRAQVALGKQRRKAEQAERLHDKGAISESELLETREALQAARATWREATASRDFTHLTSPIDGTVSVRDVRIGEVASGARRAFQVVDLDRLRVIANLPEKDLRRVHVGQSVLLQGAYDPEARSTGRIHRISPVVDPSSGTVRVTVAVDTGSGDLRPGQFVKVRVEVDRHDDVLTIPRSAVIWRDGTPIAFRVVDMPEEDEDKDKYAEELNFFEKLFAGDKDKDKDFDPWAGIPRRQVDSVRLTLGFTDPDLAEVKAGLSEGDVIVIIGADHLHHESRVKLPGDPKPAERPGEGETADSGAAAE